MNFIDLFSGIGGFRIALEDAGGKCVFSSEIDKYARETYRMNFNEIPCGDITEILSKDIPDHNVLAAGFPCQPFSLAGKRLGFEDARGTLFFEILKILKAKRPESFILENVAGIVNHDSGKTIKVIEDSLKNINYRFEWKLLNAKDYGVPQNRNRWYCIGVDNEKKHLKNLNIEKIFPKPKDLKYTIDDIIKYNDDEAYQISEIAKRNIRKFKNSYLEKKSITSNSLIANNIRPSKVSFSSNGISPCLTAKMGTGGNNIPVIEKWNRKLTEKECLMLMGFPSDFKIKKNYSQSYKQIGNSVVVPIIKNIANNLINSLK
ncbi:DNA (cytosine-5-)-methyltransferase [Staphylococcus devriesei]|uniref:DNA (cytosine-5-)-methyltransferase n=1 Tax=Staphylococcus devriesei TaxID=586733 RepID=UPI000E67BEC6|nr:DNA (cytosine-5-)-methyltransferase [Staphylococcus devriesei]MCE5091300.1 DNA (cytosine-5-)-methyltransferase [Staphylococcus devriesei]RIL72597.1 DNA (cytosine-5-)-methyltransferase [Staphylococcus devriesei]